MSPSMRRVRSVAVALLAGVGATLVATPPAAAAEMRVAIRADGAVQARGAAMVVIVTATCDPGTRPTLTVEVTQRLADRRVARGSGFGAPVNCTGAPEVMRIAIRANGGNDCGGCSSTATPFLATSAFVSATLRDCSQTCDGPTASRTVELVRDVPTFSRPRSATSRSRIYLDAATATVEAGGAGVTVRIPYKCSPTVSSESVNVALLQRTSIDTVTGGRIFPSGWTCTGIKRVGVAVFHADATLWRQGPAYLILSGGFCAPGSGQCEVPYAHTTVTVTAPTT
jgi:hypothetical protein